MLSKQQYKLLLEHSVLVYIFTEPLCTCSMQNKVERERERERENRHRPSIFFHVSSSNSNKCFLAGFVLTAVPPGSNFFTIFFSLSWLDFTGVWLLPYFQFGFVPLFRLVAERRTYPFPLVLHLRRRFGTSVFFFQSFLTTVISLCLVFLLIFSSLSPSPEIICTQSYGFKYSNLIQIIYLYMCHRVFRLNTNNFTTDLFDAQTGV